MDVSDPQVWKDGARIVIDAPHIVAPMLIAAVIGTWLFRGWLDKSEKAGLKEKNEVLEERRMLAQERATYRDEQLVEVKKQAETLRMQLQEGAPSKEVFATANSTVSAIDFTLGANSEFQKILSEPTAQLIHELHGRRNIATLPSAGAIEPVFVPEDDAKKQK